MSRSSFSAGAICLAGRTSMVLSKVTVRLPMAASAGIAENAFDLIAAAREGIIRVVEDKGRHIAQGKAAADGEARNHGDVDLDGPAGEGVDGGGFVGDFEAGLFAPWSGR